MECDANEFTSRISKIRGQLSAIETMYVEKRTTQEILQQLMAVRASLSSLAKIIVEAEVKGCLPKDEQETNVGQLVDTLFRVS